MPIRWRARPSLYPLSWRGDRVEVPRLFIAEQDLASDSWRVRLRCPVTGDISRITLAAFLVQEMWPNPGEVFQEWARELRGRYEADCRRGLSAEDARRAIVTSKETLLEDLVERARVLGQRRRAAVGRRAPAPPQFLTRNDQEIQQQMNAYLQAADAVFNRDVVQTVRAFTRQAQNFDLREQRTPEEILQGVRLRQLVDDSRSRALLKSRKLLCENLSPEQLKEFEASETFTVVAKGTSTRYLIRPIRSFNVTEVDNERAYCGTFPDVPIYDQMLAQKLYIENDPDTFFSQANKAGDFVRPGPMLFMEDPRPAPPDPGQPRPPLNRDEHARWRLTYRADCNCNECRYIRLHDIERVEQARAPRLNERLPGEDTGPRFY